MSTCFWSLNKPHLGSEVGNGFKHVLWTSKHLLWCLDDVRFRPKKFFLRLKIGPRVTFSPKNLLTFYCCKIGGFKGKLPEKPLFGTLFQESITFFWRRVRSQYWYGIKVWYGTLFGPHPTPSMCTHQAQPSFFFICGFFGILAKNFQDTLCA